MYRKYVKIDDLPTQRDYTYLRISRENPFEVEYASD